MSQERKVQEDLADYLGPVAIAQFVDIGWLVQWPMAWTRIGMRALRNGYGSWDGTQQRLPYVTEASPHGVAQWPGRRAQPAR
jgi:hypothetical protein